MFISTSKFGTIEAACGTQLYFSTLLPVPEKIAQITNISRTNGRTTVGLSSSETNLQKGDRITISQLSKIPNFEFVAIPDSYIGNFTINDINNNTITFDQNLPNDTTGAVNGELYKQANISPSQKYIIEYSVETKVPNTASVLIRPSSIIETGDRAFTPTTIVEITSLYSKSVKALIKMTVKDLVWDSTNFVYKSNQVLKTEYKEIIVADSDNKPCEIIYNKPISLSFVELNKENNWSYFYDGYLLAEFIPNKEFKDISLRVTKKNDILLPNRGSKNRIRIVADPIAILDKKTSIDKIREAIVSQYDLINNAYAMVNFGNRSYDIIIKDILFEPDDFKNIIVDIVPPVTGTIIKFEDVAKAIPYSQDIYSIPKISLIKWNNNNNEQFLGELHYNEQIYDNDPITINISGSINLSGTIKDVTNGINYIQ